MAAEQGNAKAQYELGKCYLNGHGVTKNEYDAVFLGIGANIPWKMGIEGENLDGVYGGNTLLEKQNHPNYEGKNVAIIGGRKCCNGCCKNHKKNGCKKCYCYL